ncbi:DNA topoisomerase 3 [compost metagenome]
MRLILAEKPDMGKNIALALGVKKSYREYIELVNGDIVTWAIGHLLRLKTPDAYPEYKVWKLDTLPIIPAQMEFEADPLKKEQLQVIKGLLQKSQCVVIATDPGREGEWIARTILNYCGYRGELKRLWINDLTPETINKGFTQLLQGEETYLLGEAARIRAYADYWLGFTATRFFTLKAAEITKENTLLSAGRVQTPTLRIVYDREIAIEKFKSIPFYTLEYEFKSEKGTYIGKWYKETEEGTESRFEDKKDVETLVARISSSDQAKILKYESKRVKRQSPQLLHLTALQEEARKKLGFTLKKSTKVLQGIYVKECCTYPRASNGHLSENKAEELQHDLEKLKNEGGPYQKYFPDSIRSLQGIKRYVDNSKALEHHAIVPTSKSPSSHKGTDKELTPDEEKLYELILLHTLAAFHPEGMDQQVEIITEASGEIFYTKASSVVTMGWRSILKPEQEEVKDEPQLIKGSLPQLLVGDIVAIGNTKLNEGKTTPPKRLADTDLAKAMETAGQIVDENVDPDILQELKEKGIGTVATRNDTINELIDREYMELKKGLLYLTTKGRNFIEIVYDHPIASIELTGEFEKKLGLVADGKCSVERLMEEFKSFSHSIIEMGSTIQEKLATMMGDKPVFTQMVEVGNCPLCKKPVIERKEFYGCSGYKDGCKFTLSRTFMKGNISEKMANELLANKEVPIKLKGKYGDYQLLLYLKDGKLESRKPTLQDSSLGTCPCCGKEVVEKANLYGCSGFKDGCRFSIPKEFIGKKISTTQAKKLLKNGKTDVIKGFTGKNKEFDAALKYDKQENRIKFIF